MSPAKAKNQDLVAALAAIDHELVRFIDHMDDWPMRKPTLGAMRSITNRLEVLREIVAAFDEN